MYDDPVFLLGMPRSGTTWLSMIFESHPRFVVRLSPNFSYPLKDRLTVKSNAAEWSEVLCEALNSSDPYLTQDWQRDAGNLTNRPPEAGADRLAIKDTRYHAVYQAGMNRLPKAKTIYIVRNPAAVLDSWWRSPEFPLDADFDQEWRSGSCRKLGTLGEYWGFDDWVAVTNGYLELAAADPDRYLIVSYDALVTNSAVLVQDMFGFLGVAPATEVSVFIEASHADHADDAYSVFKDPARALNQWKQHLPEHILATVSAELTGTRLAEFLV